MKYDFFFSYKQVPKLKERKRKKLINNLDETKKKKKTEFRRK